MHASAQLRHRMPADRCCNCDSRLGLELVEMDFPLRTEGIVDGERWGLVIRAPYCALCRPSSRRVPLRFAEKFLLGFLLFMGVTLASAQLPPEARPDNPLLTLGLWLAVGYGIAFGVPRWLPRQHGQSSFWRPISVDVPRAEASQGMLRNLRFGFASRPYATAFELANPEPIRQGAITVTKPG